MGRKVQVGVLTLTRSTDNMSGRKRLVGRSKMLSFSRLPRESKHLRRPVQTLQF